VALHAQASAASRDAQPSGSGASAVALPRAGSGGKHDISGRVRQCCGAGQAQAGATSAAEWDGHKQQRWPRAARGMVTSAA
jgi:hypothetical protein